MQHYLEQLIDDLHKATWGMKPPHEIWEESEADPDDEMEPEDMSYVEKYLYGDAIPISGITGIAQAQLPPVEKLTQEQQSLLEAELEKLLQYFHFYLDFPKDYPAHLRYVFIRNFWKEKHVALSFGENHIEFCDYDVANCPFPGYCYTCNEVSEQMKFDEQVKHQDHSTNDFFSGFFNDDGTSIDPESVPIPGLCVICRSYHLEDPEENFLCMMNRNDQRDDPNFICGAFQKI